MACGYYAFGGDRKCRQDYIFASTFGVQIRLGVSSRHFTSSIKTAVRLISRHFAIMMVLTKALHRAAVSGAAILYIS